MKNNNLLYKEKGDARYCFESDPYMAACNNLSSDFNAYLNIKGEFAECKGGEIIEIIEYRFVKIWKILLFIPTGKKLLFEIHQNNPRRASVMPRWDDYARWGVRRIDR
jgi:hypothetical protein